MTTKPDFDRTQIELRVSVYFDTIYLFVRRQLPASLFDALTDENKDRVYTDEKYRYEGKKRITCGWMITIHQPTPQTFELLSRYRCSGFHLAFDFHDTDPTKLLVQKWHTQDQTVVEHTTYWGLRTKRRNIAAYSSKASKITGADCNHIELRFTTPAACRRAGVSTIGDLLQLDPMKVLSHQTKFMRVDLNRLDQILDGMAKSRSRHRPHSAVKQHLQNLLLRVFQVDDLSQVSAQQMWDFKRGFRGCLVAVELLLVVGNSLMITKATEKVAYTTLCEAEHEA